MPEIFGHLPDGRAVERVTLQNGVLRLKLLTLGAIVQDMRLDGVDHPLVLGADSLAPYLGSMQYFGAMVGRYANRIAQGEFSLDGQKYHLSRNALGRHCLHGGQQGSAARLWSIADLQTDRAVFKLTLPDGEMGFPGTLDVQLCIALRASELEFDIRATCDRDTVCNFSHHGFFILDDSGSLARHRLQIDANSYLPVDDDQIPTGEIAPVTGTQFDFRTAQNLDGVVLDHNFCLSNARTALRSVVRLGSDLSGLGLQMETTEPGVQVYTANHLPKPDARGLGGRHYGRHAGIALEAQIWPDAPNQPSFPSAALRPGETYHHKTRYVFSRP